MGIEREVAGSSAKRGPFGLLVLLLALVGCASASSAGSGPMRVAQLTGAPEVAGVAEGGPTPQVDPKISALFAQSVSLRLQSDRCQRVTEGRESADGDLKNLPMKEVAARGDELWNRAVDGFKKVLSADPKATRAAAELGEGYFERGKMAEGMKYLKQAAEIDPGDFALQYELGSLLERFGVADEAVAHYQAARLARDANIKTQLFPVVLLKLGTMNERAGHLKEAVEAYEAFLHTKKAEIDFRGNSALQGLMENRGPVIWQTGQLYMKLGDNAKAVEVFKQGLAEDPKYTRGRLLIAQAYANEKDYISAEKAAQGYNEGEPGSSSGYLFLIELYESQDRLPEAMATTEKLLERNPDDYQTRFLLGGMYERSGKMDAAIECYRAIVKKRPRYVPVYLKLGGIYEKSGRGAEALWVYSEGLMSGLEDESIYAAAQKVIAANKDLKKLADSMKALVPEAERSHAFYTILAMVERAAGRLDEAAKAQESALKLNANSPQAYVQLALIYVEAKQPGAAIETLKKAEGNGIRNAGIYRVLGDLHAEEKHFEEAATSYEKAQDISPWDFETTVQLAEVYRKLKKPEQAEELLKRGKEANPADAERWSFALGVFYIEQPGPAELKKGIEVLESYVGENPDDPKGLWALSHGYMKEKDYAHAEGIARRLVALSKDDLTPRLLLAGICEESGKLDEAESTLRDAAKDFGKNPDASAELGRFLITHRRKTSEGIRLLESAAASAPKNLEGLLNLARAYDKLKKFDKAVETAKKAAELKPEEARVGFTLATIYQDMGKYAESEKELRAILKRNPGDAQANNGLGYFLAEASRNLDEAEQLVKKALETAPGEGAFIDSMGWVYYKQGKLEEALKTLEQAFGAENDGTIAEHVGDVLYRLDRREDAAKYWKKAQELDPWLDSAGERLKLLEQGKNPLESGGR